MGHRVFLHYRQNDQHTVEIAHHTENLENSQREKRQATNTKMSQTSASSDTDFRAGVVKMLQQSITNAPEPQERIQNLNNEIEVITKNQKEITEQKTQKQTQTLAGWPRWQSRDNRELSR